MLEIALRCLPSFMLLGLSYLLLWGTLNQGRRAQRPPHGGRPARARRPFTTSASTVSLAAVSHASSVKSVRGDAGDLPLRRVA